jgi:hypothetical protein
MMNQYVPGVLLKKLNDFSDASLYFLFNLIYLMMMNQYVPGVLLKKLNDFSDASLYFLFNVIELMMKHQKHSIMKIS